VIEQPDFRPDAEEPEHYGGRCDAVQFRSTRADERARGGDPAAETGREAEPCPCAAAQAGSSAVVMIRTTAIAMTTADFSLRGTVLRPDGQFTVTGRVSRMYWHRVWTQRPGHHRWLVGPSSLQGAGITRTRHYRNAHSRPHRRREPRKGNKDTDGQKSSFFFFFAFFLLFSFFFLLPFSFPFSFSLPLAPHNWDAVQFTLTLFRAFFFFASLS